MILGLSSADGGMRLEKVGLDRTHPQEANIKHHTPSLDLEPSGEEKERPTSQQLEARH